MMVVLAGAWAEAATLIAVVAAIAAVLIVAMLCGWKPWARPSVWEWSHARREGCPRDDVGAQSD